VNDPVAQSALLLPERPTLPALEYNVARTATRASDVAAAIVRPGDPLSDNALRVLSMIIGRWIDSGDRRCDPDRGVHPPPVCGHHADWLYVSRRQLALDTFANDGGATIDRVTNALDELASRASRVLMFDAATGLYTREVTTILSWQDIGSLPAYAKRGVRARSSCRLAWTIPVRDSLLEGAFQRLPIELVRHASGTTLYLWLAALSQLPSSKLHPGQSVEYSITGPFATIPIERLGLGRANRPSKVKERLERAVANGNELQSAWRMELRERARGLGLKIVLTKERRARFYEDAITYGQGLRARTRKDGAVLDRVAEDGFQETIKKTSDGRTPERNSDVHSTMGFIDREDEMEPGDAPYGRVPRQSEDVWDEATVDGRARTIAVRLHRLYNSRGLGRITVKQWRLLLAIEARGSDAGCELSAHMEAIDEEISALRDEDNRASYADHDPLAALIAHDWMLHPRR
jgi:hypothetical protein